MKTPRQILMEKAKRYREQNNIHSKGPWEVQEHSGSQYIVSLPDDATICQMTTDDDVEVIERDALLIAAAPDMLVALESCRELLKIIANKLGHVTHDTDCETTVTRELIRGAIAKARGES